MQILKSMYAMVTESLFDSAIDQSLVVSSKLVEVEWRLRKPC